MLKRQRARLESTRRLDADHGKLGDPSVEAWEYQGSQFFYISGLFFSTSGGGSLQVAVTACKVAGWGSSASLECGQPTANRRDAPQGFGNDVPLVVLIEKVSDRHAFSGWRCWRLSRVSA